MDARRLLTHFDEVSASEVLRHGTAERSIVVAHTRDICLDVNRGIAHIEGLRASLNIAKANNRKDRTDKTALEVLTISTEISVAVEQHIILVDQRDSLLETIGNILSPSFDYPSNGQTFLSSSTAPLLNGGILEYQFFTTWMMHYAIAQNFQLFQCPSLLLDQGKRLPPWERKCVIGTGFRLLSLPYQVCGHLLKDNPHIAAYGTCFRMNGQNEDILSFMSCCEGSLSEETFGSLSLIAGRILNTLVKKYMIERVNILDISLPCAIQYNYMCGGSIVATLSNLTEFTSKHFALKGETSRWKHVCVLSIRLATLFYFVREDYTSSNS